VGQGSGEAKVGPKMRLGGERLVRQVATMWTMCDASAALVQYGRLAEIPT